MLNDDDSKAASNAPSATPSTADRPANTTTATTPTMTMQTSTAPQDGHHTHTDDSLPRKRQRVEDPPSPSSVALPRPSPATAVSPQQTSKAAPPTTTTTTTASTTTPASRSNSITAISEPETLEPSIINVQPSEELTRFVSDFIFLNLNEEGYENLEVRSRSVELLRRVKAGWAYF